MKQPASEILVPDIAAWPRQLAETDQKVTGISAGASPGGNSLIVDRLPTARTVQPHGLSGPELDRLAGAVHFMELHCHRGRCGLWWLTTDRATARVAIADIGKRITRLQHKYDLPAYSATVFETRGGLHAHIGFVGNWDIAERLHSSAFGQIIKVDRVTDANTLARKYLVKERTPQAGYRRNHVLGGRLPGSHRLEGGGDRVRLSEDLKNDAIAAEYVKPWKQTNARRNAERKAYRLRRLYPSKAPRLAGQLPLLPEIERPVSRLHDFGHGIIPPAVAVEMEFRRRRLGLSQNELGSMIGRSQGQYANAIRGHDPISATAVNRLRELLL
jgi:hypothetical protein